MEENFEIKNQTLANLAAGSLSSLPLIKPRGGSNLMGTVNEAKYVGLINQKSNLLKVN